MNLTTALMQTLRDNIIAAADAACVALEADPTSGDLAYAVADLYNLTASPDFFVWHTKAPIGDILNAIIWTNMTPVDAVPTTPSLAVELYAARSNACQGKQMNLQNLIMGRTTIDASRPNIRTGLQDSLTGYPAGAAGATVAAGWTAVQLILSRKANRVEKVLATGTGSQAVPATMGAEGTLTHNEVLAAMAS